MKRLVLGALLFASSVGTSACAPRHPELEYGGGGGDGESNEDLAEPAAAPGDAETRTARGDAAGAAPDDPAAARRDGTAASPARVEGGAIPRHEVAAVLDAGPAAFLGHIRVRPSFEDRRFCGWEIVSFWPDDPRFSRVDLLPGDVVVRVNGKPIERPEQFQDVWESLRFASELVVEYRRGTETRWLKYAIVP